MAKKRKAAKRATTAKTAKRTTARRPAAKRASATSAGDMFNPSSWLGTLIGSQTGRVIIAEVLVAAAGAAAGVLMASRTEAGAKAGRAVAEAGISSAALMKEAAMSAAAAAREVISSKAMDAVGNAAKSMLGGQETQHDLAEKAMRMRRDSEDDITQSESADNVRRMRERD